MRPAMVDARTIPAALDHRNLLLLASLALGGLVAVLFAKFEVAGLGIAHLFYLAIALAALASGPLVGVVAGVAATCAYAGGVLVNPQIDPSELLTLSTAIRLVTYVTSGFVIGWFAKSNRRLVATLRATAERDYLTGVLNMRAFEDALAARTSRPGPFALVLADLDGLKQINDGEGHAAGNDLLRRFAAVVVTTTRETDVVARVGGDEFAVLAPATVPDEAQALCARLDAAARAAGIAASFGWALHPIDGGPGALFHRADERLYRAKRERAADAHVVALLSA